MTTIYPCNFIGDYAVIKFEDGPDYNRKKYYEKKYYKLIDRKGNILHSAEVMDSYLDSSGIIMETSQLCNLIPAEDSRYFDVHSMKYVSLEESFDLRRNLLLGKPDYVEYGKLRFELKKQFEEYRFSSITFKNYAYPLPCDDLSEVIPVKKNGKWLFVNRDDFSPISDKRYGALWPRNICGYSFYSPIGSKCIGIIDCNENIIVEPKEIISFWIGGYFYGYQEGETTKVVDIKGREVTLPPEFFPFSSCHMAWGYKDRLIYKRFPKSSEYSGIFSYGDSNAPGPKYESLISFKYEDTASTCYSVDIDKRYSLGDKRNNLVTVLDRATRKWGLIDLHGKEVLPCICERISTLGLLPNENWVSARKDGVACFIDIQTGKTVLELQ